MGSELAQDLTRVKTMKRLVWVKFGLKVVLPCVRAAGTSAVALRVVPGRDEHHVLALPHFGDDHVVPRRQEGGGEV